MPFMAYMSVNYESGPDGVWKRHPEWVVPGTRIFTAPESGWTELLCQRIREFLKQFPVEWMAFDGFAYGGLLRLSRPAGAVCGAAVSADHRASDAGQGQRDHAGGKPRVQTRGDGPTVSAIRDAIKETSPGTQIGFNVPFWKADDPLWSDHPCSNESEMLLDRMHARRT